jgi:hypothetical protein
MKKTNSNAGREPGPAEMLPEYDCTGKKGVRDKYHQAYRGGYTVRIDHDDGTISLQLHAGKG